MEITPTDNGTNVRDGLNYRQKTGLIDAAGQRHKIGAYVALELRNVDQLLEALYLFGIVGIGFKFPGSAMDQFDAKKPWSVVPGPEPTEGHYVPFVAYRTNLACVSWGRIQQMTWQFTRNTAMKPGRFCRQKCSWREIPAKASTWRSFKQT